MFPTDLSEILDRVKQIEPARYARTRNFHDGAISRLSPYISRGVISTKFVYHQLLDRGFTIQTAEKYIQELAWRDYWQLIWRSKGDEINHNLKAEKYIPENYEIPSAIISHSTGVEAIDNAIEEFYQTGYLHNHMRMYIASIACSVGKSHWKEPAKWMYYHLLDADWASNALSWQWIAGTNSNKMYYANQENINKYWSNGQKNTFLDCSYDQLVNNSVPRILQATKKIDFSTDLPVTTAPKIDISLPTIVYNAYNLDPFWLKETEANRIFLMEPSHLKAYPMGPNTIDFIQQLSGNIEGIQLFNGEFSELQILLSPDQPCYYKEHPLNKHYVGTEFERDWMFDGVNEVSGSFFKFWKAGLKNSNG